MSLDIRSVQKEWMHFKGKSLKQRMIIKLCEKRSEVQMLIWQKYLR